MIDSRFRCIGIVVFGGSAGGIKAFKKIAGSLPEGLPFIMAGALHISNDSLDGPAGAIDPTGKKVVEAVDKERPRPGRVYLAPPGYHLLIEPDGGLALDVGPPVNYSRPSIDVLFESASAAFGKGTLGILLTGAGRDGARGLAKIKEAGGVTVVQDPEEADFDIMPRMAMEASKPDYVLKLDQLADFLNQAGNVHG